MDRRIPILNEVYQLHAQLIAVFHQPSADNLLLSQFCKKFTELIKALKPTITDKHFDYLFKPTADLENKAELAAHLHAAAAYAVLLSERIEGEPDLEIGNETVAVIFDYARLLKAIAKVYGLPTDSFAGSRNTKVDAYTSFKIATQFFWHPKEIQRSNTLNGFTIFALRQSLESGAKELIGLQAICNASGQPDHYTTQIPWQFLVEYGDKPYFQLPFSTKELHTIYKWSNHFVHTGNDAMCYVTAMAIQKVEQLFQTMKITHWPDRTDWVYANIISSKAMLKADFTNYLANLNPPKTPQWRPNAPLAHFTG